MRLNRDSFFTKLLISHLMIILISLLVLGVIFAYLVVNYYSGLKEWDATNNIRRIAHLVSRSISQDVLTPAAIKNNTDKINTISQSTNMEIGIINAEGQLLFKSTNIRQFNLPMELIEIESMLKGSKVTKKIFGPDDNYLLMIFPLIKESNDLILGPARSHNNEIVGGIIIQTPLDSFSTTVKNIIKFIIISFAITLVAAVIISIIFTRRVTKPIENIKSSALKIVAGKYEKVKLPQNSSEEIKHLVKTFNFAVDQVEETINKKNHLEKMQKDFIANVSHEFRAPLTSIKGFLELISDQNLSHGEIKKYISIMNKDAEYIEHLLSDLLTLSDLESRKLAIKKDDFLVLDMIKRALNSLQTKLENKNINLETVIGNQEMRILVDQNRIHQVLINLLDNAIKYSPINSTIKIGVSSLSDKEQYTNNVKFVISDQGPGISSEELDDIWNRFYKVNTARTREVEKGYGLGLAIVKEIIQLHGGKIYARNNAGRGVSIIFFL